MEKLVVWGGTGLATAPLPQEPPPADRAQLLTEARQVYSLGA